MFNGKLPLILYSEDKYEEEETDNRLENGPIDERGCTDILFCLFFIAGMVAFVVIAIIGFARGDPKKLGVPYDPDSLKLGLS